jgi:hypothetical protein
VGSEGIPYGLFEVREGARESPPSLVCCLKSSASIFWLGESRGLEPAPLGLGMRVKSGSEGSAYG